LARSLEIEWSSEGPEQEQRGGCKGVKTGSRERERKAQLLSLWHQRPDGKRTERDVLVFYGEMERAFPHLLNRRGGDAYRNLISELQGHIEER
jgi:hypothetical protein